MNENKLTSKNDDEYYTLFCTRPSILPPLGVDLGVLDVAHVRSPAGTVFPWMSSSFVTIAWVVAGRITLRGTGWKQVAKAHQVQVADTGESFETVAEEDGTELYYILLDGPKHTGLLKWASIWPGVFPYRLLPLQWLEMLAANISNPEADTVQGATASTLVMNIKNDIEELVIDKAVWKACQHLHKNWNDASMNVDTLLTQMNMPRSTLSPRFKKVTGTSILEYLMNIRYQKALKRLTRSSDPIGEIAYQCGFECSDYFSQWFKKRAGMTARAYRKSSQADQQLPL